MRIFIGIDLPKEYKDILRKIKYDWKDKFKSKIKWTGDKNFHITLRFIGEVPDKEIFKIGKGLATVDLPRFSFKAGGGGFFPNLKRPRVMWIGCIKGDHMCTNLSREISAVLEEGGISQDKRQFKAHLTLGRIKFFSLGDDWKGFLDYLNEIKWPEINISHFVLWKSTLKPTGPIYTIIETFPLK